MYNDKVNTLENGGYFIGGTDMFVENEWIWGSTRQPITLTRWEPNEPNDGGGKEECLILNNDGRWNDGQCDSKFPFICQAP